jgi:CheY-like chemotaxis protein
VLAPQVLDVNEVVRQTDRMLRRLIGEDVELIVRLAPQVDAVRADPGQLEQALLNLAVNARDAMPSGGTLRIESRNVDISDRDGRGHQQPVPGRYVKLTVADSGVGIGPEIRPRLFEPFFTTKPEGQGTGLGLAVVHGFVKQTGGHIEVESEPGQGATFHIYLPRFESARGPTAPPGGPATVMPTGTETILVVEDEDAVRVLASRVLEDCGYTVLAASNGQEALLTCDANGVRPDLLVTDVVMPEIGGPALARRVSVLYPDAKVLYVSGYTNDAVVRSGIEEGEVEFLQKPFSPLDLARKVRAVLDGAARHGARRIE